MKKMTSLLIGFISTVCVLAQTPDYLSQQQRSRQVDTDVTTEVKDNFLILYTHGDLGGLNVELRDNFNALGDPQDIGAGWIFVKNIKSDTYKLALMIMEAAPEGSVIMKIPILIPLKSLSIYLNINGVDKVITVDLTNVSTGNKNINQSKFSVYPNPVKDKLFVRLTPDLTTNCILQLINMEGKTMQSIKIQNHNGNITMPISVPNGMYALIIRKEQEKAEMYKEKIIVVR